MYHFLLCFYIAREERAGYFALAFGSFRELSLGWITLRCSTMYEKAACFSANWCKEKKYCSMWVKFKDLNPLLRSYLKSIILIIRNEYMKFMLFFFQ